MNKAETKKEGSEATISVVIPVIGDLRSLTQILHGLRSLMRGSDEIIVVDGGKDNECEAVADHHDCIYLRTRPGRGHQLHSGASRATGDIVWFLHADAHPPESALASIRHVIAGGAVGGYFRFRFTGKLTWYKQLLAWFINVRSRFGVPYGDQGLFICRSDYAAVGGFPDVPLFEEVSLIKAARRHGRFVEVTTPIGVSSRRWEQDGWVRRTLENRLLALGYMLGVSPRSLAQRYRQ